jgi:hypothetical protein
MSLKFVLMLFPCLVDLSYAVVILFIYNIAWMEKNMYLAFLNLLFKWSYNVFPSYLTPFPLINFFFNFFIWKVEIRQNVTTLLTSIKTFLPIWGHTTHLVNKRKVLPHTLKKRRKNLAWNHCVSSLLNYEYKVYTVMAHYYQQNQ